MAEYQVCTRLETIPNLYGGYDCDTWEVVDISNQTASLFPPLSIAEANEISLQCCTLLVIAYGFRVVGNMI